VLLLCRMNPRPDYGFDTYKGSGKLTGKVRPPKFSTCYTAHERLEMDHDIPDC
jgi:hypothetical protein